MTTTQNIQNVFTAPPQTRSPFVHYVAPGHLVSACGRTDPGPWGIEIGHRYGGLNSFIYAGSRACRDCGRALNDREYD